MTGTQTPVPDLVRIQVKRGGKPVAGLAASDFELRDSGVRQQIQAVTYQDVPLSVLLALDGSSSVRGERLAHLKDAATAAVGALRPDDQTAILTFSQRVDLRTSSRRAISRLRRDRERVQVALPAVLHADRRLARRLASDRR